MWNLIKTASSTTASYTVILPVPINEQEILALWISSSPLPHLGVSSYFDGS